MSGGRRRFFGLPIIARKDRDDDLILFREMFKREKERNFCLLQPISDEFEPNNGNHPLYKIPVGRKGFGLDSLVAESEKNDYNWLKTPPATPMFPSLETFPLAEKLEESKPTNQKQNPPNKKSAASSRSVTPTARPSSSSAKAGNTTGTLNPTQISYKASTDYSRRVNSATTTTKLVNPVEKSVNSTPSNTPKKNSDSKQNPRSRGVSPQVRSRIPATVPGFPDKAPPNLIKATAVIAGRPSSTSRGRPGSNTTILAPVETKLEQGKPRSLSSSPSVARGRKTERFGKETEQNAASKGNRIIGSRMVEKLMNARRSGDGRNDQKPSY